MKAKLRIKNFRTLKNVTVDMRPTMFLLGPNGAGKSTFIKALLFLTKNLNFGLKNDKVIYNFPDLNINLRDYDNTVSNNKANQKITFQLDFKAEASELEHFSYDELQPDGYTDGFDLSLIGDPLKRTEEAFNSWSEEDLIYYFRDGNANEFWFAFAKYHNTLEYNLSVDYTNIDVIKKLTIYFDSFKITLVENNDSRDFGYVTTEPLFKFRITSITKQFSTVNKKLYEAALNSIVGYLPLAESEITFYKIAQDILRLIEKDLKINKLWHKLSDKEKKKLFFKGILLLVQLKFLIPKTLGYYLSNSFHFNTVRESPKFAYELSNDNDYYSILNSLPTKEDLLSDTYKFNKNIGSFLRKSGFGKLVYTEYGNGVLRVKLLLLNNNSIDLADAPSGLIQVFPILAKIAFSEHDSYDYDFERFSIEQPELHLHPKLQSMLAEFIAKNGNLIIETHSEHIIKKVQVMFAKKQITDERVAIYYFENKRGRTKIKKMEMDENGFFKEPWPDGFFDDSFELTKQLIRAGRN